MQAQDKRDRGDGSLFRRPNKRGGESWIGAFYVDGKRYMRSVGRVKSKACPGGLTPGDAEAEFKALRERVRGETIEADLKRERDEATARAAANDRTIEEVGDELIAEKEADELKAATIEGYRSWLKIHLVPFFGPDPVRGLARADVEAFRRALAAKGLKPKSIENGLGILSALMNFAVDHEYADANPVSQIRKRRAVRRSDDIRFLTVEEVEAVVRKVPDDQLGSVEGPMYLTAAMSGLRQGELLGLRWRDVDFVASRIRVVQSFVRQQFGTPKSNRGRSVPLAPRVAAELERLYQRSSHQGDDDLVFAHPSTGRPIDRSKLLKRYKKALARAGVRPLRFHDLRHTFGTRMAAAGVPIRTIQEWMGHADIQTTQRYADYAPSEHEAEWVERAFRAPDPHDSAPAQQLTGID